MTLTPAEIAEMQTRSDAVCHVVGADLECCKACLDRDALLADRAELENTIKDWWESANKKEDELAALRTRAERAEAERDAAMKELERVLAAAELALEELACDHCDDCGADALCKIVSHWQITKPANREEA